MAEKTYTAGVAAGFNADVIADLRATGGKSGGRFAGVPLLVPFT